MLISKTRVNDARKCIVERLDWNAPSELWRYTTARTIAKEVRVNTSKLKEVEAIMLELNGGVFIGLNDVRFCRDLRNNAVDSDTKRLLAPPWLRPVLQEQREHQYSHKRYKKDKA